MLCLRSQSWGYVCLACGHVNMTYMPCAYDMNVCTLHY